MLTVEKAHLLLTREDGLSESPSHHRVALAAAALADHRSAGIVTLEDVPVDRARVLVTAAGTTGDPVLDSSLGQVDALAGRPLVSTVAAGKPDLRKAVVAHLTETGRLTERKAFLATRHVPRGTERTELLAHLTAVVLDEAEPADEDVLPGSHERYDRREMVRRIEALTREDLLVQAVRRAVGGTSGTVTAAAAGSAA
mgnify:CR=1 FL=1